MYISLQIYIKDVMMMSYFTIITLCVDNNNHSVMIDVNLLTTATAIWLFDAITHTAIHQTR